MSKVDVESFLADLYELRKIGAFKTGVNRPTYSPQDMEARRWLLDRMRSLGLEPTMDGIGNVFGRHTGTGPHLLVGSHIESQVEAGWLDGALGVVAGLALARMGLPVDVCAFADEEGHFTGSYKGSRSFIGELTEEEIDQSCARFDGPTLRSALETAGLAGIPRMEIDCQRYKAFLEMHIEQGSVLEKAGLQLGVVTGIPGIWTWQLNFEGQQDHAGGTSMEERRDAGLAAVRLLAAVDQEFPRVCGDRSVWTTCRITVEPGAPVAIIPGKATVRMEFRDLSLEVLERMEAALRSLVRENNRRDRCKGSLITMTKSMPAGCDAVAMRALSEAAEAICPSAWQEMPSGGGHDAKILARKLPMAMLFVPSIRGISHHWTEDTSDADLALGIQVLAEGASRLLCS